ncbi:EthD domain-containing protein [Salmonella enterica]|uniref:EthD domain-containing protein n=1 Tax=Salmonella enterica TaxID=28901 RepID=UPI00238098CF|nr:EthD domain-containing protein [Salmonella enterica]WDW70983.1 EthD domain-containing protein [Salmonella enterica subsp. enterica serovar Uganda]
MLKLVMCVKRRAHLTREEFDHYWRNQHASLVVKHSERLGIRKYIQTVPLANSAAQSALQRQEIHCPSILMVAPSCGGTVWNRILQPEKQKKD